MHTNDKSVFQTRAWLGVGGGEAKFVKRHRKSARYVGKYNISGSG